MMPPVFILGAGFSLAANRQYSHVDRQFAKRYPLASGLGPECFGPGWSDSVAVEAAFDAAIRSGDREPIRKLVKLIQTADYYLGWPEARDDHSIYIRLIDRFVGAQFVSFNYDSLLEQVLLRRGLWNPHDGFGVPAETGESPQHHPPGPSEALVLHLHGSVLLYAVEFSWKQEEGRDRTLCMAPLRQPRFLFDPDNLGHCFSPFIRATPDLGYRFPEQRVVVPLPDKSQALLEPYVRTVYGRACEVLSRAAQVIAIGYRFAECDRASFEPLLRILIEGRKPLCIVGPEAALSTSALRKRYAGLNVTPVDVTFEAWSESDFRMPGCAA